MKLNFPAAEGPEDFVLDIRKLLPKKSGEPRRRAYKEFGRLDVRVLGKVSLLLTAKADASVATGISVHQKTA